MKSFILGAFLFLFVTASSQDRRCVVVGKINNDIEYKSLYYSFEGESTATSVDILNREFRFEIIIEYGRVLIVESINSSGYTKTEAMFFISPGDSITVNINRVSSEAPYYSFDVEGSSLARKYAKELAEPILNYNQNISDLTRAFRIAKENSKDTAVILHRRELIISKCIDVPRQFILKNKSSILSINALRMMGNGDPNMPNAADELRTLFNSLDYDVKISEGGKEYSKRFR